MACKNVNFAYVDFYFREVMPESSCADTACHSARCLQFAVAGDKERKGKPSASQWTAMSMHRIEVKALHEWQHTFATSGELRSLLLFVDDCSRL